MKNCKIKVDNYKSLTIPTPKLMNEKTSKPFSLSFVYPHDDIPLSKCSQENFQSPFVMKNLYFIYNCKKNKEGSRDLILNGNDLYYRIGRRFMNWDVPYLSLFLSKYHDVIRVNLVNNEITCPGFMSLIECLIGNEHVLELDVRNNNVGDYGMTYLCHSGTKLKIRVLRLSGNKVGIESSQKIAMMLATNTYIEYLDVADMNQNESSLIYYLAVLRLNQTFFNKTLKSLNLSRPILQCLRTQFDSTHIATCIGDMLRYNETLEALHLQKFNFYDHNIEEIFCNAKYNKVLRILDLSCNNIGDHAAELLGNWLETRPPLRSLSLAHNIITDNGIRTLCSGIQYSNLLVIDLSYNRFTDKTCTRLLNSLKKSPQVQQLRIFGNNIGHLTAKVIERMLLSDVLNQKNIDVKPYEVNGIFYLAHYHKNDFKEYLPIMDGRNFCYSI